MTFDGLRELARETGCAVVVYNDRKFAVQGSIAAEDLERDPDRHAVGYVRPNAINDMMGVTREIR